MIIRSLTNRFRALRANAWVGLAALTLAQPALSASYIVKMKSNAKAFQALSTQKSFAGVRIADSHATGKLLLVDLGQDKQESAHTLAKILERTDVEYVVENKKVYALDMPNDTEISKQWSLAKVRAGEAWTHGVGSRQVVVAVTDTGVDYNHTDLKDNIWHNSKEIAGNGKDDDGNGYVDDVVGYDFNKNDADPMDETSDKNPGHGSHCAGIMGAVGNNGRGISGMSQALSIMPVRFLGADGSGDLMGAAKAIDYAVNNGAQVISASWGAEIKESDAKPVIEAMSRGNDKGVIFVAAAANSGKNNDTTSFFPTNANLPNVISVAASDNADAKPSWSNYGTAKVHVAAPGKDIYSTLPKEKFGNLSGTSMATPLVSGLVGLILSHNADLKGPEVKAILQASGTKVAIETACECRVDAANAVERVLNKTLTVVPQAATIAPNATLQFKAIGGKAGYKFASSADSIASIDANGLLTAKENGEVNVTVTDATGANNTSLRIRVVTADNGGGDNGGGGGGGGECPADPQTCEMLCQIMPTLPWCKQ